MRIFPRAPIIRATRSGIGGRSLQAAPPPSKPSARQESQCWRSCWCSVSREDDPDGRSRTGQRSFSREHVDLSLIAEEATETLLPLADSAAYRRRPPGHHPHGRLPRPVAADDHEPPAQRDRPQPPRHGTVQLSTAPAPSPSYSLSKHRRQLAPQAGLDPHRTVPARRRTHARDHARAGLGLAIVKSITQAHDPNPHSAPRAAGNSASRRQHPSRHRTLADNDQRSGRPGHGSGRSARRWRCQRPPAPRAPRALGLGKRASPRVRRQVR